MPAVDIVVGVVKLRGIPCIEELNPQFKPPLLVEVELLEQREIGVVMPPRAKTAAGTGPESEGIGLSEERAAGK